MGQRCSRSGKQGTPNSAVKVTTVKKASSGNALLEEEGVKLVLVGETFTGKTCLVGRLSQDRFITTSSTVGAAFQEHAITVAGRAIKLNIWDTAGQERFHSMTQMYYRGAAAALIVYDITKTDTFEGAKRWVDEIQRTGPPNMILCICGNKADLEDARAVPTDVGKEYSTGIGGLFMEVSAKTGQNVKELLELVGRQILVHADKGLISNP
ncbi:small GTPase [Pelomyxa schiedti]|nr:small GTPase [Pelomyxa schiedti]